MLSTKEIKIMFGLGTTELIVIMVILLLLFGSTRLPGLAKGMGESIRNFKKAVNEEKEEIEEKKTSA
jgi:TatA/E family protein of Tat protein translocase